MKIVTQRQAEIKKALKPLQTILFKNSFIKKNPNYYLK